ncbi:MAG: SH3 domain-containing protein [Caldilineaceae bacterium]
MVAIGLLMGAIGPAAAQDVSEPDVVERVAVGRGQGAMLLTGASREVQTLLPAGSLVIMIARSADGGLLYVETGAMGDGWVPASSLLTVNASELPVRALEAASASTTEDSATDQAAAGADAAPTVPTVGDLRNAARTSADAPSASATASESGVYGRVTLTSGRLNLRAGPGTDFTVVAKASPGEQLSVIGRTSSGDWVQVRARSTGEPAWAAVSFLDLSAALTGVAVAQNIPEPPPAPVAPAPAVNKSGLSGTLVFNDMIGGPIYGYNLDTDQMWTIGGGVDPAISPDGRQVAFTRDGGGNGLYVINIDGTNERLLYSGQELLRSPKWSPDGQYIVFSRSNGYEDCRLIDGGVCLPDEAILDGLPPELQSQGAVAAVHRLRNQREYFTVLSRIGVDGNNYRDIPSLNKAGAPDWTDAGIVYHSSGAGIQRTDDSDVRSTLVANDELHGYFLDPDWQPGGGRIAFYRKLGGHWQIHLVNPDGTGLAAITHPVTALVDELPSNVAPTWSPDGQHIVYVSNRNSIESAGAWHFWVMDADGSNQRRLPIDLPLYYTFSSEQMISWGPSLGRAAP